MTTSSSQSHSGRHTPLVSIVVATDERSNVLRLAIEGVLRSNLAESLIAMGRNEEANRSLEIALEIAREGDDRAREGEALKLLGVVERERLDHRLAGAHLNAALRIARDTSNPLLAAEVLRERGELRLRERQLAEAEADWEEARRGFRALGATLDADRLTARIDALLEEMRREAWGGSPTP